MGYYRLAPPQATAYTPLRFSGQYFDPETQLHFNLYRYYDPEVGQYLSVDPLGLEPSPNPNAYVSNPTTSIDPFGLFSCETGPNRRGPFDFRPPNPDHPPHQAAVDAMRAAPVGGNVDCSELAEYILKRSEGKGEVINFTSHSGEMFKVPQEGGRLVEEFKYHDVYTDGKYVYDPELGSNPVPLGDFKRAIRHLNPDLKIIAGRGGYDGPLW